jgi:hypothetical protein
MFGARYHGSCAACGDDIHPGDMVRYVDDGLIHAGCADASLRVRPRAKKAEVCGTCFMEKPCPCEDGQ